MSAAPYPRPELTVAAATLRANDCPSNRKVIWRGDLASAHSLREWLQGWDPNAKVESGEQNAEIVDDPRFGRALRVHYPAGSSSASYAREGHPTGGIEFHGQLPGSAHEGLFLSYWLRFDPQFPWVRGGKLPGLCGGTCPSGGADVTGIGGWSMRYMWRTGGAGEQYAYVLPARAYGTELDLSSWSFRTGRGTASPKS